MLVVAVFSLLCCFWEDFQQVFKQIFSVFSLYISLFFSLFLSLSFFELTLQRFFPTHPNKNLIKYE